MTNDEILAAFIRPEAFPEEAVALASKRREEMAPLLIAEIDAWAEGRRQDVTGYNYLPDIAFHLLAEWRDGRGLAPVLALLASPHHEVLSDTITEDAPALLARLCSGDSTALKALVLDPVIDEFVRDAALNAMVILVIESAIPRQEMRAFLLQVFAAMPHQADWAWCGWSQAVSTLLFEDLIPQVKQLFDEEAIDITWMEYEDFESDLENARKGAISLRGSSDDSPVDEMRQWRYVEPDDEDEETDPVMRALMYEAMGDVLDHFPTSNPYRDVGRNDPCPCGSGKKFKKCCLPKVEAGEL